MIDIDNYKDKGRYRGVVKREKQGDTKGKKGGKKAEREREEEEEVKREAERRDGRGDREKREEKRQLHTHLICIQKEEKRAADRQRGTDRKKEREYFILKCFLHFAKLYFFCFSFTEKTISQFQ